MPPIIVPCYAKCIATQILVIVKWNGRKDFILRGFVCDIIRPNKELPIQSKQLKHKSYETFKIKACVRYFLKIHYSSDLIT